jgi:parallel beta helix pectate lyase-like protein
MIKLSRHAMGVSVVTGLAVAAFLLGTVDLPLVGATQASPSKIADFYVAINGKDNWSGTRETPNERGTDGPFATPDRARRAVQQLSKRGRNAPIVVMFRQGTYFLNEPLKFTSSDSGSATAPIVYEAYRGETAVISGGRKLSNWRNASGNTWTTQLSSDQFQNFENLFFNEQRRFRPRTTVNSYLYNEGPVLSPERTDVCSTSPEKRAEKKQKEITDQSTRQGEGRRSRGDRLSRRQGRRQNRQGRQGQRDSGQQGWICSDRFLYRNSDVAGTYHSIALGDVEILTFEKWTMSRMRLASVDPGSHSAYLTGPTMKGQNYGFLPGHRYLIENVKEALNQPGQWYLDRCTNPPACTSSNGEWTLTYLAKPGENPNTASVIAPQLSQIIVGKGLQYVTFKGLTFAHDNWVPGPQGLGDTQGGPGVTAALAFSDSSHIVFDSDIVAHTQGYGLEFTGGSSQNQIINNALYDVGYGGIRIGAKTADGDTDNNVPGYTRIENNIIAGGGRVIPSGIGTGVWSGNAHHSTITHNEIYDFYSGAIRIGYQLNVSRGIGNAHDNVVSFNLVYNLGQGVTSDFGGIYSATSGTTGNQIVNNVIHDVVHDPGPSGHGGEGIYFDQAAANTLVKNNLVYRISQAGLFVNFATPIDGEFPQNDVVTNNIFAFIKKRVLQRGGENPNSFAFTHNIVYLDQGTIQANPGRWSCFDNCSSRFALDYNLYWHAKGDRMDFITTDPTTYEITHHDFADWQRKGEDQHSIIADPLFVNPRFPADDFSMKPGSPASKIGFVPFDPKQAGRSNPVIKVPPVPPAFPLQLPDDPNDYF